MISIFNCFQVRWELSESGAPLPIEMIAQILRKLTTANELERGGEYHFATQIHKWINELT